MRVCQIAYENLILPNSSAIVENKKVGKRRFVTVLFTDKSGMNPKENPAVGELAGNIKTAIAQEEKLNQNIEDALGGPTSNIGKVIKAIMEDEV